MPPKKSNLNNACSREARRKRVQRSHQKAEQSMGENKKLEIIPDFIAVIKTEDDLVMKTEIKDEPFECGGWAHESDSLVGHVPAASAPVSHEHDSEEELPLPSQVVIKEENFSEDEVANDELSESSPQSLVQQECDKDTMKNTCSNGLEGLRKYEVRGNKKSVYIGCPFCEETMVRSRFSSNHLPNCKKWMEYLGIVEDEESDFRNTELPCPSLSQPIEMKDNTHISSAVGFAGTAIGAARVSSKPSSTQCPFCEMTVVRSTYSSDHLRRCRMWKKYLGNQKQIDKYCKPLNSGKCKSVVSHKETSTLRKRRRHNETSTSRKEEKAK